MVSIYDIYLHQIFSNCFLRTYTSCSIHLTPFSLSFLIILIRITFCVSTTEDTLSFYFHVFFLLINGFHWVFRYFQWLFPIWEWIFWIRMYENCKLWYKPCGRLLKMTCLNKKELRVENKSFPPLSFFLPLT